MCDIRLLNFASKAAHSHSQKLASMKRRSQERFFKVEEIDGSELGNGERHSLAPLHNLYGTIRRTKNNTCMAAHS